jgi:3-deoxy-D-manno-octulosonic-acid transferase
VSGAVLGLYSALMRLAQPLLKRRMARRAKQEPGYGEATGERFGYFTQAPERESQLVWLHAVSLGETRAAGVLLERLRAANPGLRVLLTHGTATGRAEGKALLRAGDVQVWQPWDNRAVVKRFFDHFKPRLGLLMETEVWPCAVAEAAGRHVSLVLVNGRMSEKSLQQALRLSLLALPAYRGLTAVYAQTDADAERYRQLGVRQVEVLGNLKFDAAPSLDQQAVGKAWRDELALRVVMLASSRDGEEAQFLEQIKAVDQQMRARAAPEIIAEEPINIVKWLIVPRHPQRFDDVAALVLQSGLSLSRRSTWQGSPFHNAEAMQAQVWLGDSLGEMPLYYALSSVALLGGSFEKLGGQNLIEAAACGCPVVMGPHTFNFSEVAEKAEAAGAALRAQDMAGAVRDARILVNDDQAQRRLSQAALAFASSHQGAAGRTSLALTAWLPPQPGR